MKLNEKAENIAQNFNLKEYTKYHRKACWTIIAYHQKIYNFLSNDVMHWQCGPDLIKCNSPISSSRK